MSKVLAFLANGFEEVEALAVIDLLRRANIETTTVSITSENMVMGAHGIGIKADSIIDDIDFETADVIFLPGGMPGTNNLDACQKLTDNIVKYHNAGKMVTAICAAPKVLGRLGILNGKNATCYPGFEECLIGANCLKDKVVVDGNVVTSRGMGTAVELGLKLVEILSDKENADELGRGIQYYLGK